MPTSTYKYTAGTTDQFSNVANVFDGNYANVASADIGGTSPQYVTGQTLPALTDLGTITQVRIGVLCGNLSDYVKLQPIFNGTPGTASGNLGSGTIWFDITSQQGAWTWTILQNLDVKFLTYYTGEDDFKTDLYYIQVEVTYSSGTTTTTTTTLPPTTTTTTTTPAPTTTTTTTTIPPTTTTTTSTAAPTTTTTTTTLPPTTTTTTTTLVPTTTTTTLAPTTTTTTLPPTTTTTTTPAPTTTTTTTTQQDLCVATFEYASVTATGDTWTDVSKIVDGNDATFGTLRIYDGEADGYLVGNSLPDLSPYAARRIEKVEVGIHIRASGGYLPPQNCHLFLQPYFDTAYGEEGPLVSVTTNEETIWIDITRWNYAPIEWSWLDVAKVHPHIHLSNQTDSTYEEFYVYDLKIRVTSCATTTTTTTTQGPLADCLYLCMGGVGHLIYCSCLTGLGCYQIDNSGLCSGEGDWYTVPCQVTTTTTTTLPPTTTTSTTAGPTTSTTTTTGDPNTTTTSTTPGPTSTTTTTTTTHSPCFDVPCVWQWTAAGWAFDHASISCQELGCGSCPEPVYPCDWDAMTVGFETFTYCTIPTTTTTTTTAAPTTTTTTTTIPPATTTTTTTYPPCHGFVGCYYQCINNKWHVVTNNCGVCSCPGEGVPCYSNSGLGTSYCIYAPTTTTTTTSNPCVGCSFICTSPNHWTAYTQFCNEASDGCVCPEDYLPTECYTDDVIEFPCTLKPTTTTLAPCYSACKWQWVEETSTWIQRTSPCGDMCECDEPETTGTGCEVVETACHFSACIAVHLYAAYDEYTTFYQTGVDENGRGIYTLSDSFSYYDGYYIAYDTTNLRWGFYLPNGQAALISYDGDTGLTPTVGYYGNLGLGQVLASICAYEKPCVEPPNRYIYFESGTGTAKWHDVANAFQDENTSASIPGPTGTGDTEYILTDALGAVNGTGNIFTVEVGAVCGTSSGDVQLLVYYDGAYVNAIQDVSSINGYHVRWQFVDVTYFGPGTGNWTWADIGKLTAKIIALNCQAGGTADVAAIMIRVRVDNACATTSSTTTTTAGPTTSTTSTTTP